MNNEDVVFSRRLAGQVKRYHTWPCIRQQTVGEHSWQVARLYEELFGPASVEVAQTILWHDAPEIRTGDLPFSAEQQPGEQWAAVKTAGKALERVVAKRMGLPRPTLTDTERHRIKVCDLLECMEYGIDEWRLGSQYGLIVAKNVTSPAMLVASELPERDQTAVITWIKAREQEMGEQV